jgi:hypothetical protein
VPLLVVVGVGLITGWHTVVWLSPYVAIALIGLAVVGVVFALLDYVRHQTRVKQLHERSMELDVRAKDEALRRENERHSTELYLATWRLPADELGNRPLPFNPYTGEYINIPNGNYMQPVPHTLHWDYRDTSTKVTEEPQVQAALPPPVPSGRSLLENGTVEETIKSGYYLLVQVQESSCVIERKAARMRA